MSYNLIFAAIPKPFKGHIGTIQRNAIRSWARLPIDKQIVLLAESSAQEIADEVGATVIPDCPVDEYGTPLFGPAIEQVAKLDADLVCYLNADIITMPELAATLDEARARFDRFLMVAKRWNYDCDREFDFSPGWAEALRADVLENGRLFAPQAIDMFAFTPAIYAQIPPFAIGRSYWDNWMIAAARRSGATVLDVTDRAMLVHQNHDYTGFANLQEIRESIQGRRNFYLAGDCHSIIATIDDASHRMAATGEIKASATPLVSVVIPFAGSISNLRRLLNSLVHQKYPRTFIETIVVINSNGLDLGSIKIDYPQVCFTVELKKSAAAARNKGVALATGEIIAFVDDDCVPDNNWIAGGVQALELSGPATFIGGAVRQVPPGGKRTISGAFGSTIFLQQENSIRDHGTCVTANLFVRRQDLSVIGLFDERFPGAAGEDWEWCQRARSMGFKVDYAQNAAISHPMLRNRRELSGKLDRIARGNLQRAKLQGSGAATGPGFGWYVKRCRKAWSDPRLTLREKAGVPLMLASLLPRLIRNFRQAQRQIAAT